MAVIRLPAGTVPSFIVPTQDHGRRSKSNPPRGYGHSSLHHAMTYASVFGVRGGVSKVVFFEKPKHK